MEEAVADERQICNHFGSVSGVFSNFLFGSTGYIHTMEQKKPQGEESGKTDRGI